MGLKAEQQVRRLPFLPSSNLSLGIFRSTDEAIGREDCLAGPSQSELMGKPHLVVGCELGSL